MVHAKVLGTDMMSSTRFLHDGKMPWQLAFWREQVFLMKTEDQVRKLLLFCLQFRVTRAGWTREDLKALRQRHRTVTYC